MRRSLAEAQFALGRQGQRTVGAAAAAMREARLSAGISSVPASRNARHRAFAEIARAEARRSARHGPLATIGATFPFVGLFRHGVGPS